MYVKLFTSLYQGTLRGRTNEILVFTNLLAHADQHGTVDMHWQAIADETGLSREAVEQAILNLESPDLESRSPECNGCRIIRVDDHKAWGWQVVNYVKYRAIRSEDDRREQNRLAQERWRARNTDNKQDKQNKPKQKQKQKKEDQKKEPVRGSRLPQGWKPDSEMKAWALTERPDLDHARELASFGDYWQGVAGAKGVKLDWPATYRNWIRRAAGRTGAQPVARNPNGSSAQKSPDELKAQEREALAAMQRQHRELGIGP